MGGVPRLGAASDEYPDRHEIPHRQRRRIRSERWRSTRLYADVPRLSDTLPERRQAREQSALFDATGERGDAVGDEQGETCRCRQSVSEEEPASTGCVARRREDV